VKLTVTGDPAAQFYCHCDHCQKVHGAGYVPIMMYPAGQIQVTEGEPLDWALVSTPRMTCPKCGTRIFAEVKSVGMRGLVAHLMPAGSFKPMFHIQCQHAMLPVVDKLPHFKSFPAAFGGSDDVVDW
jgi:hypothetical protein